MIKVNLRTKAITGNKQSFYLDFYPAITQAKTGKLTRREFLGLFLYNEIEQEEQKYLDKEGKPQIRIVPVLNKKGEPKKRKLNQSQKLHNQQTKIMAEQIMQKRNNQLNKPEIYTGYEKEQLQIRERGELSFIEYFKELAAKRSKSNYDNWISAQHYLEKFTKGNLKFADLNEKFCNDFRDFLLTTSTNKSMKSDKSVKVKLSQNSAVSYFNKVKAALKQAFKDGYLQVDLNGKIKSIKQAETQIQFLTLDELNILAKTDCSNPLLKRAALFSALTGMAFKEIQNLVWSEIQFSKEYGHYIPHKRQKTGGNNYLPISSQAFNLLGERKASHERVFDGLNDRDRYYHFHLWLAKAGVKDINFHGLRHSYATIQLSLGTDLYTVSKLLDHKNIRTTQVYAKVVNQTKREAADKLKLDF